MGRIEQKEQAHELDGNENGAHYFSSCAHYCANNYLTFNRLLRRDNYIFESGNSPKLPSMALYHAAATKTVLKCQSYQSPPYQRLALAVKIRPLMPPQTALQHMECAATSVLDP